MLTYILFGLYVLIAIIIYCVNAEKSKRQQIFFDKCDNFCGAICWLPILIFCIFMIVCIFIGEYIIHKPISFILNHTFRPLIVKIVDFLESESKKEN